MYASAEERGTGLLRNPDRTGTRKKYSRKSGFDFWKPELEIEKLDSKQVLCVREWKGFCKGLIIAWIVK
jgi:hypothetical protein